jgi:hypothetical protein
VDAAEHDRQEPAGVDGRGRRPIVDLRTMPREVQEIAFEKGMIPYIPADQE